MVEYFAGWFHATPSDRNARPIIVPNHIPTHTPTGRCIQTSEPNGSSLPGTNLWRKGVTLLKCRSLSPMWIRVHNCLFGGSEPAYAQAIYEKLSGRRRRFNRTSRDLWTVNWVYCHIDGEHATPKTAMSPHLFIQESYVQTCVFQSAPSLHS